jgi:hypothetical protein
MAKTRFKKRSGKTIVNKPSASIFPMRFGVAPLGNDLFVLEFSDYNNTTDTINILSSIILHKEATKNLAESLLEILSKEVKNAKLNSNKDNK